jgi:hypothetical protein
MAQVVLILII